MSNGSLICVGTGMTLGAHITPVSRNYIEQADVVFVLTADGLTEQWIMQMNQNVRSLQPYYQEGKSRKISYREMISAMLHEVKDGKKVVGAFYGHPGVFALVPHTAIRLAKSAGYYAHMEPGISAEDCLFADLAIDPGTYGCQHYEASQFMFYQRQIDPSAYLILWQIGLAGEQTLAKFSTGSHQLQVLVRLLTETYPYEHQVILYEAKSLAIQQFRHERITLGSLPAATLTQKTTLVIPPAHDMQINQRVLQELEKLRGN